MPILTIRSPKGPMFEHDVDISGTTIGLPCISSLILRSRRAVGAARLGTSQFASRDGFQDIEVVLAFETFAFGP